MPSDRGSAGVWVLALSGVLMLSGTASVLAGSAIVTRHEADAAADLAALAAASHALSGSPAACGLAGEIAQANGARLESCALSDAGVVDVTATVTVRLGSLGLGVARAQARAGPAEPAGWNGIGIGAAAPVAVIGDQSPALHESSRPENLFRPSPRLRPLRWHRRGHPGLHQGL